MNIFNIHTNRLERRAFMRLFVKKFTKMNVVVLYNKLFKLDKDMMEKMEVPTYNLLSDFWEVQDFNKKYDVCIVFNTFNIESQIDRIKDINSDNLIILDDEYRVPKWLSKNFDTDLNNISSFKGVFNTNYGDDYFIIENSKFHKMSKDQIITFTNREIKLNSILK
ncbi:MAG: hypothetical protein SLAVMIC_00898 [uncultured marine phage]|uniref:Uncharacterized protein n=1 Tax=uncultured marine phage TaxID=707152 RepID=A0A8D9FQM1_9VIRU|nr:MAG: hypothetical protein SLAVMIC_00898 [uncultured marine phage]